MLKVSSERNLTLWHFSTFFTRSYQFLRAKEIHRPDFILSRERKCVLLIVYYYLFDNIFFKGFENSFCLQRPVFFPKDVEMLCKLLIVSILFRQLNSKYSDAAIIEKVYYSYRLYEWISLSLPKGQMSQSSSQTHVVRLLVVRLLFTSRHTILLSSSGTSFLMLEKAPADMLSCLRSRHATSLEPALLTQLMSSQVALGEGWRTLYPRLSESLRSSHTSTAVRLSRTTSSSGPEYTLSLGVLSIFSRISFFSMFLNLFIQWASRIFSEVLLVLLWTNSVLTIGSLTI